MQTNFFQSIQDLQVAGDWTINIARETAGRLVVSVLFANNQVGDNARKNVPPLLLKGTAKELDEGFFAAISQPVKDTAQLFANMEAYLKGQELAKINSLMEKDKAEQEEKGKTDRQKKYGDGMKKASELEAEGKFREAWMKVPDVNDYPEQAEAIRKRKSELSAKFAPDLFQVEPKTI